MRFPESLKSGYQRYVEGYQLYLRRRGFGGHVHNRAFVLRGFLACWTEPGFHRFWRLWNPGIGYMTFGLYLALGGRSRRTWATIGTFALNGLAHTLLICPFYGHWSWTLIVTFLLFGLMTVLNRRWEPWLRQDRWPTVANAALNVGLVLLSFDIGFKVNALSC